jgi:hypothetical protein
VPKENVANKSVTYEWSGRGDLNARPPAPKAVFGMARKLPVFKCFGFRRIRRMRCDSWNCEALGGFRSYIFIYSPVQWDCRED